MLGRRRAAQACVGLDHCFRAVNDGNSYYMPKVDDETGEPMSDAPDAPLDQRGGMEAGDPGLEGATETGRSGIGYRETGSQDAQPGDRQLPAERGGAAGGGGQSGG